MYIADQLIGHIGQQIITFIAQVSDNPLHHKYLYIDKKE